MTKGDADKNLDHEMDELGVRMYKQMLKEKALQMVEEGATVIRTAELMGASRRTIHRWIESARAQRRGRTCIIG